MCRSALERFNDIWAGAAADIRNRLIVKAAKHFECQTESNEHVAAIVFVDPSHERAALFVVECVKSRREIIKELCGGSGGIFCHFQRFRIEHRVLRPSWGAVTLFRVLHSLVAVFPSAFREPSFCGTDLPSLARLRNAQSVPKPYEK